MVLAKVKGDLVFKWTKEIVFSRVYCNTLGIP